MMNTKTSLMSLLVMGALAVGCAPEVIDEDGNQAGQNLNGGNGQGGAPTGGGVAPQSAVAMTRAQLDALWDAYWAEQGETSGSSTTSGGGGDLDPNDLFVQISDLGASCASPTTELSCGGHWELSVALPPAYQAVGIYDLEDPAIVAYSSMSETDQPNSSDPQDCGWGGGSLGSGTIEVTSVSASEIVFVLTMDSPIWNADPSGTYTAALCAN